MYAIVEVGGKQYKAEEGRFIDVDLIPDAEAGSAVNLDRVLLLSDTKKSKVGQPLISGASVTAKVMSIFKDKKVIVYKQRPKKGYRRKQGHRQPYTRIMIEKIQASL
jgi:large subunit ribosomal protein L21